MQYPMKFQTRRNPILATVILGCLGVVPVSGLQAQTTTMIDQNQGEEKSTTLQIGKTVVVDLPRDAADIVISNPEVADGILRTARQVILIGKSLGNSDVLFFDRGGNRILTLDVRVGFDDPQLESAVARHFPGSNVVIERLLGNIILSGQVGSSSEAQDIYRFVSSFAEKAIASGDGGGGGEGGGGLDILADADADADSEDSGVKVINRMSVQSEEQVMLKVRIAEISRSVTKRLGVNWQAGFQATQLNLSSNWAETLSETLPGSFARELLSDNDTGADLYGLNQNIPDWIHDPFGLLRESAIAPIDQLSETSVSGRNASASLQTTLDTLLKALEQYGLVRTLAEPSLTAVSGEQASFLAGGEFPITVFEDGGIGVEFKKFGVSLDFVPVVLSGNRISLKVATEISELSSEGSVVIGSVAIPSLTVRRTSTTVELPSGGAMVVAGLLQQSTRRLSNGLPGLRKLPVLGQLFRSEEYENNESELVILVTPYLVKPGQPDDFKMPTDGFGPGSDLDMFLLGKLHANYGAGQANPDTARRALSAPFGYVME